MIHFLKNYLDIHKSHCCQSHIRRSRPPALSPPKERRLVLAPSQCPENSREKKLRAFSFSSLDGILVNIILNVIHNTVHCFNIKAEINYENRLYVCVFFCWIRVSFRLKRTEEFFIYQLDLTLSNLTWWHRLHHCARSYLVKN